MFVIVIINLNFKLDFNNFESKKFNFYFPIQELIFLNSITTNFKVVQPFISFSFIIIKLDFINLNFKIQEDQLNLLIIIIDLTISSSIPFNFITIQFKL